MLISERL